MKIYRYMTGPIQVNTYLVYDENNVGYVVDPGGPSRQLKEKVTSEGIDVQYILLTHGHGDHIGGIEDLLSYAPNAKIVAGTEEAQLLSDPQLNSSLEFFGKPIVITPDRWVKDGDQMKIGLMDLTFLHTPGHTLGGYSIVSHGYCFSGDSLFQASIGRTDFWGGSFPQLMDSIRTKLFTLPDDTVVLPGHMEQTSIGFEKENNPFVR